MDSLTYGATWIEFKKRIDLMPDAESIRGSLSSKEELNPVAINTTTSCSDTTRDQVKPNGWCQGESFWRNGAPYDELITDDTNLTRALLPEYLDYYGTALLWARFITLKIKNSQPITPEEDQLANLIRSTSFAVPEPILIYLRSFGNVTTTTKQHLFPSFPHTPGQCCWRIRRLLQNSSAPGQGIDDSLHLFYCKYPCLGILAEAFWNSISNGAPVAYVSTLTYGQAPGFQPSANLLGKKHFKFYPGIEFIRCISGNVAPISSCSTYL